VKLPDNRMAMINVSERQADLENGHFCYYDRKLKTKFTFDPFDMSPASIKLCSNQEDENPPPLDE